MKEIIYYEVFTMNDLKYTFKVSSRYKVSFTCKGGKNVKLYDPFDWFGECSTFDDINATKNPVAVFRKVGELLKDFIYTQNPPNFEFSASTNKKIPLYDRIAKKLERELRNYNLYSHNGNYYFYRKVE